MRDHDLDIARLTTQVGDLEHQLAAAKADRDAAFARCARLGRLYGATRGLRVEALRQLRAPRVNNAIAVLERAAEMDGEWDAQRCTTEFSFGFEARSRGWRAEV